MPCDSIQIMTVQEKLENLNVNLLADALRAMGFRVTVYADTLTFSGTQKGTSLGFAGSYNGTQFTASSSQGASLDINSVKRAYSEQVVAVSAMELGWSLEKTGEGTYEAEMQ